MIKSFQELLDNIYKPLFEVTIDPHMHPQLHMFLQYVSSHRLYLYAFGSITVSLLFVELHSCITDTDSKSSLHRNFVVFVTVTDHVSRPGKAVVWVRVCA